MTVRIVPPLSEIDRSATANGIGVAKNAGALVSRTTRIVSRELRATAGYLPEDLDVSEFVGSEDACGELLASELDPLPPLPPTKETTKQTVASTRIGPSRLAPSL